MSMTDTGLLRYSRTNSGRAGPKPRTRLSIRPNDIKICETILGMVL